MLMTSIHQKKDRGAQGRFLLILALGFNASCSEATTPVPTTPVNPTVATVTSIRLSVADTAPLMGTTTQATATVLDQNGNPMPNKAITWKSSDDSIATVSVTGLVTAKMRGQVTISAEAESKSSSLQVRVLPTPEYDCDSENDLGNYVVCAKTVLIDGSLTDALLTGGTQIELNSDGINDIIWNMDRENWYRINTDGGCYTYLKSSDAERIGFLVGTRVKASFKSFSPTIAGGSATMVGFRDKFIVADFNEDGRDDFYPQLAAENGITRCGFPFVGSSQHLFLSTGAGAFSKVWISDSTTTHGYAVGRESRDGFSLVMNTPWNCFLTYPANRNCLNKRVVHVKNGTSVSTESIRLSDSYLNSPYPLFYSDWYSSATFLAAIDIDKDGKKDIASLSSGRYGDIHYLWRRKESSWSFIDSIVSGLPSTNPDWTSTETFAEGAIVEDFNGDGYEDMFLAYWMGRKVRVLINNRSGKLEDKTTQWIGSDGNFTYSPPSYSCDVNNDGKPDVYTAHADNAYSDNRIDLYLSNTDHFNVLTLPMRAYRRENAWPTCYRWNGKNGLLLNRMGASLLDSKPLIYVTLRSKR